jgi:hypothetical protein
LVESIRRYSPIRRAERYCAGEDATRVPRWCRVGPASPVPRMRQPEFRVRDRFRGSKFVVRIGGAAAAGVRKRINSFRTCADLSQRSARRSRAAGSARPPPCPGGRRRPPFKLFVLRRLHRAAIPGIGGPGCSGGRAMHAETESRSHSGTAIAQYQGSGPFANGCGSSPVGNALRGVGTPVKAFRPQANATEYVPCNPESLAPDCRSFLHKRKSKRPLWSRMPGMPGRILACPSTS